MKKQFVLEIDTSRREETLVRLAKAGKVYEKRMSLPFGSSQQVLPLIESVLKEAKGRVVDISEIRVHTGPGSYTGLRVGVAVASVIGELARAKVNGSADVLPKITYDKDPWK